MTYLDAVRCSLRRRYDDKFAKISPRVASPKKLKRQNWVTSSFKKAKSSKMKAK